jgi:hypothetical protein
VYNTNPIAGNSKGFKHTPEVIEWMRFKALGRKHSEETKLKMSISRIGREPTTPGLEVEITNIETNLISKYRSIRQAAQAIGVHNTSLLAYVKNLSQNKVKNTIYRGKYLIKVI